MKADLMARVADERALFRERLKGVSGNEPGRLYVVLVEKLE